MVPAAGRAADERRLSVTYLTTRQWSAGDEPCIPGVRVIAIARDDALYGRGHRRLRPVLRFGLALWLHLLRFGRHYDAVHTSAMSSWSAFAAATSGGRSPVPAHSRLVGSLTLGLLAELSGTDRWHSRMVHAASDRTSAAPADCPFRASRDTIEAASEGKTGLRTHGLLGSSSAIETPAPADPLIVYAGRFIPEKQVSAIVPALAQVRELPMLRACLIGQGPDEGAVRDAIRDAGLDGSVEISGS